MQNKEKRFYSIGDFVICYHGPGFQEKEYLSNFRVEEKNADITYDIYMSKHLECPRPHCACEGKYEKVFKIGEEQVRVVFEQNQKKLIFKESTCDGIAYRVELHEKWWNRMHSRLALMLFSIPERMLEHGGFFLHASVVLWKGKALLFTGPKQVGKSTQAELWENCAGAEVINGDRALLRKKDGVWWVYGSPYCGTSKICHNQGAPLGAVVLLSKSLENSVKEAVGMESVIAFLEGASFKTTDKKQVELVSLLISEVIRETSIYKMECTPTEDAVRMLEEWLW